MASVQTSPIEEIDTAALLAALRALRKGDFSARLPLRWPGLAGKVADTFNDIVEMNERLASELARLNRVVGKQGKITQRAAPSGMTGGWVECVEAVNSLVDDLVSPTREMARVIGAVAKGDLSQSMLLEQDGGRLEGEFRRTATIVNSMVDQLASFASEVTRVVREVGTEGKLGGQARVKRVAGTWKDLTDSVNFMASNLTGQVRNIADVTTAVANGDLSRKITVDVRGEIRELKNTINTMVDQLSTFADEVTRVAREVGTEGRLGGQATVEGVSGTWKGLTDNVNQLAETLTTQLRAIAEVSTAVTQGDMTRSITVEAEGEVAELKDRINQMIAALRETTLTNQEQDWLNSNLARFSGMLQGQRDLQTVSRLIMSELTPLVGGQHGAFFTMQPDGDEPELRLIATYGYKERRNVANRYKLGESLVGQAALERNSILIASPPADYIRVASGLGEASPAAIIVMPVLFEDRVMAVIELASFEAFSAVQRTFLDQVSELIGVVLNTILATMRTEELLVQSQQLAQELQSQSEELQTQQEELQQTNKELEDQAASLKASEELLQQQQEELQQTNEELEEKAALLAEQNERIELKNREIELARKALEEKAEQLALSSKYKSEFLANMSHELRTPLNSLLILAKLLADNPDGNLSDKQIEFAQTIYTAGSDLLDLINDILDLSKVEAGKMDVHPTDIDLEAVRAYVERTFRPVAEQKGLDFELELAPDSPRTILSDEQRLQQVLKNLLSNAFKFTDAGSVRFRCRFEEGGSRFAGKSLSSSETVVCFEVADTGIGISADKLRLIFEAFQQADGTTSRRYGGTGLGLSISREIARLLGGEIHAESTQGEGSTFRLYLPPVLVPPPAAHDDEERALPRVLLPPYDESATVDPSLLLPSEVSDDRATLDAGDRVVLIVEDDADFARTILEIARERGFKGLVALRGDTGLALAHEYRPDAIVLDMQLPVVDGWVLLERLKRDPETRHIPVHIVSGADGRQNALRAGAVAFLEKPATKERLDATFAEIASFIDRGVRRLLVVEDDKTQRDSIVELVGGGDDVEVTAVGSSEEAVARLDATRFDCMVLDLKLPQKTGFALLEQVKKDERFRDLPIIVYTGKELTRREETSLKRYAETIIVKDASSPERLLAETSLFLHRVEARLPVSKRRMLEQLHGAEAVFEGKRVLIVDDDVRNVFALTSVLESYGMEVVYAENGKEALELLRADPRADLVLMDIMMPELDGYETMRSIRGQPEYADLPIIALTAKAMKGDREKSIDAGASDYVTKPVDTDQLVSLMRVWLYR